MGGVCEGSLLPLAVDRTSFGGGMQRQMAVACFGEMECANADYGASPGANVASCQRYVCGMACLSCGRPPLQAAMVPTFVSKVPISRRRTLLLHTKWLPQETYTTDKRASLLYSDGGMVY
ncbi:Piso0_005378 [Millerozyma farinosa CBS 7064]|uniref:Piso0_005378 protein n=1 Tax=Pichia sorbitophila (strain ATCC MYA-4447 / BCRC 22081 / CBS 7064 / NBRC 10061 / NRRL Y-12695) TaxID=559304 RepID=G8Y4Y3_PICSO|nr:Piso0_005378 [Millerozyma farinosa CBS 7064]